VTRLRGRGPFDEAKARASIIFASIFFEGMDGRIKSGHDEWQEQ
jgi:hypothetical protein